MIFENRNKNLNGYCSQFPYGYVLCRNGYDCLRCTLGDRIRQDNAKKYADVPLFTYRDARKFTDKAKGATWWHYPIILSPEVMEQLGLECSIYNQIAIADGGGGVFAKNPVGYIDVYLFANPQKRFTITRNQSFGIPNAAAVRRYDELFFWDLAGKIDKLDNQKGAWCL